MNEIVYIKVASVKKNHKGKRSKDSIKVKRTEENYKKDIQYLKLIEKS